MKHRTGLTLVILSALAVLGASCGTTSTTDKSTNDVPAAENTSITNSATTGSFSTNTSTSTTSDSSSVTISIVDMSFTPVSQTVQKGTVVTWTNNDSVPHTVTGGTGGPASGQIAPGKTYQFTFSNVGTYAYHCSLHPTMLGTIVVTE